MTSTVTPRVSSRPSGPVGLTSTSYPPVPLPSVTRVRATPEESVAATSSDNRAAPPSGAFTMPK